MTSRSPRTWASSRRSESCGATSKAFHRPPAGRPRRRRRSRPNRRASSGRSARTDATRGRVRVLATATCAARPGGRSSACARRASPSPASARTMSVGIQPSPCNPAGASTILRSSTRCLGPSTGTTTHNFGSRTVAGASLSETVRRMLYARVSRMRGAWVAVWISGFGAGASRTVCARRAGARRLVMSEIIAPDKREARHRSALE